MFPFLLKILLAGVFFIGCTNDNIRIKKKVDPESIYFDYRVWGSEESSDMTVRLQYFIGDEEGNTVLWQAPAKVEFDDQLLSADSSRMNGFYYEARVPFEDTPGLHSIVLTDHNERQYREDFGFPAISLETEISAVVKRKELVFKLAGVEPGDVLRVLMTDTFFYSKGIDRIDTVRSDSLIISGQELDNLKNGPVYMEVHKENTKPLKMPGKGGGKLSVSYSLKRAFELQD
jgi:hypothetical protein